MFSYPHNLSRATKLISFENALSFDLVKGNLGTLLDACCLYINYTTRTRSVRIIQVSLENEFVIGSLTARELLMILIDLKRNRTKNELKTHNKKGGWWSSRDVIIYYFCTGRDLPVL